MKTSIFSIRAFLIPILFLGFTSTTFAGVPDAKALCYTNSDEFAPQFNHYSEDIEFRLKMISRLDSKVIGPLLSDTTVEGEDKSELYLRANVFYSGNKIAIFIQAMNAEGHALPSRVLQSTGDQMHIEVKIGRRTLAAGCSLDTNAANLKLFGQK